MMSFLSVWQCLGVFLTDPGDPGQVDSYTLFLPSPFLPLLPSFSPSPSHVISLCSMTIIVSMMYRGLWPSLHYRVPGSPAQLTLMAGLASLPVWVGPRT